MSGFSEWKKESSRGIDVEVFLNSLLSMGGAFSSLCLRDPPGKITITIEQQLFMDVVFALLSELDYGRAQEMGLPHAYKQWQFSFHGITVRANRNASGWTYPDRIKLPDGTIVNPNG